MATKKHKPSEWQSNLIKRHKIKNPDFKGVIAIQDSMGKTQQEILAKKLDDATD